MGCLTFFVLLIQRAKRTEDPLFSHLFLYLPAKNQPMLHYLWTADWATPLDQWVLGGLTSSNRQHRSAPPCTIIGLRVRVTVQPHNLSLLNLHSANISSDFLCYGYWQKVYRKPMQPLCKNICVLPIMAHNKLQPFLIGFSLHCLLLLPSGSCRLPQGPLSKYYL